jgi:hypothetical protein
MTDHSLQQLENLNDEEFGVLLNGYDSIFGNGDNWASAYEWLVDGNNAMILKKSKLAVIFLEKPKKLLATGRTKTGKGTGKALSSSLVKMMPLLTDEQIVAAAPYRADFGEFAKVNFSLLTRAGLIALEMRIGESKIHEDWLEKYGGSPLHVDYEAYGFQKMSVDTRRIFDERLVDMKAFRHRWEMTITS